MEFDRQRTALHRSDLSRPVRLALHGGLLAWPNEFFDYGCGRGGDLKRLDAMGLAATGWDPVHAPDNALREAVVVNLGYVVNVVESPLERADILRKAWALTRGRLIVSARLVSELAATKSVGRFADGVVTQRGTFQKFYEQEELKAWIAATLSVVPVAAAPGIFYVFRDEAERTGFLAARYRRQPSRPRPLRSTDDLISVHRELFDSLAQFVAMRGRPPGPEEWDQFDRFTATVGSLDRGMRVLQTASADGDLAGVRQARSEDLILCLALARFDGRPDFHRLDASVQRDVKAFFGSYKRACNEADSALMEMGNRKVRDARLAASKIGKLLPSALYLHISALPTTDLVIRLYEGCARHFLGTVEDSNIVKLARVEARVSFLAYPDFEKIAHPALATSVSVDLQTFKVRDRDYRGSANPPILHRKETFLKPDHPAHAKFSRLTRAEEAHGLYEETSRIGTREGWSEVLERKRVSIVGHRVVKQV